MVLFRILNWIFKKFACSFCIELAQKIVNCWLYSSNLSILQDCIFHYLSWSSIQLEALGEENMHEWLYLKFFFFSSFKRMLNCSCWTICWVTFLTYWCRRRNIKAKAWRVIRVSSAVSSNQIKLAAHMSYSPWWCFHNVLKI